MKPRGSLLQPKVAVPVVPSVWDFVIDFVSAVPRRSRNLERMFVGVRSFHLPKHIEIDSSHLAVVSTTKTSTGALFIYEIPVVVSDNDCVLRFSTRFSSGKTGTSIL